jgi:hypothetical protein
VLNARADFNVSQLSGIVYEMPREILAHRIRRLVQEAIKAGRFRNEEEASAAAGRSPQWLSEFIIRAERDPKATVRQTTAEGLARALGITLAELVGSEDADDSTLPVDIYPARARAVDAARKLGFPEAAIQIVLREQRNDDPPAIYWFRRIEAEAERIRPASDLTRRDR